MLRPILISVAAALFSTMALSVATAATLDKVVEMPVGYADLDLTHADGRKTFKRRIAAAVRHVCPAAGARDLAALSDLRACREAALADANRQASAAIAFARRGPGHTGVEVALHADR